MSQQTAKLRLVVDVSREVWGCCGVMRGAG
jgi:hypothetical protein